MIEFMDEIVESVEWFAKRVVKITFIILEGLAERFLLITAPVWILPYKMIRIMVDRTKRREKMKNYVAAGLKAGIESIEKANREKE